jgi:peptide/nickel transport system permease protein
MTTPDVARGTGLARPTSSRTPSPWRQVRALVARRVALGLVTLFLVTIVVFAATQVLPGNAAYAVLGHSATPQAIRALEKEMGLDRSAVSQYWSWLSGLFEGRLGNSLANGEPVGSLIGPRLENSAFLVVVSGVVGTLIGVLLGLWAALRRDKPVDHVLSVTLLGLTSLPEFVVGIVLVLVLASVLFHVLPAVSVLSPGQAPWDAPKLLILPTATLVIVTVPYLFRMVRAATTEALESEYVEMARLNGLSPLRVLVRHALPNTIAPTIQVIGLNCLYLAGGIVVVEFVFNYPGIGQGLVNAVSDRDIPIIQFTVLVLAAFYVLVNIVTDVIALLATPRRLFR